MNIRPSLAQSLEPPPHSREDGGSILGEVTSFGTDVLASGVHTRNDLSGVGGLSDIQ